MPFVFAVMLSSCIPPTFGPAPEVSCAAQIDSSASVFFSSFKLNFDFDDMEDGYGSKWSDSRYATARDEFNCAHTPIYEETSYKGYIPSLIFLMSCYDEYVQTYGKQSAPLVTVTYKGECTPSTLEYVGGFDHDCFYCLGNSLVGIPYIGSNFRTQYGTVTFRSIKTTYEPIQLTWQGEITWYDVPINLQTRSFEATGDVVLGPLDLYAFATYNLWDDSTSSNSDNGSNTQGSNDSNPNNPSTGHDNFEIVDEYISVRLDDDDSDGGPEVHVIDNTIPNTLEGREVVLDLGGAMPVDFFQMNKRIYYSGSYTNSVVWHKPLICRVVEAN